MIGVAALIAVLSVMKGFRYELVNNLVGINGHIFVMPTDTDVQPFVDYAETAERLAAIPGVKRAVPLIEGQAFASTAGGSGFALVRGMRAEDLGRSMR